MEATQHRDRPATIDSLNCPRREIRAEISVTVSDLRRQFEVRTLIDVANVGEPLCGQQLVCDILWGKADARVFQYPHCRRLKRPLLGLHLWHPSNARRPGQRRSCQKSASCLDD